MAMRFNLGTVLSVTTGINLSPGGFGDVCTLLDYMTGDALTDLGRVAMQPRCAAALLAQFPALAGVEPPGDIGPTTWQAWLADHARRLGDTFDVRPLS